MLIKRGNVEIVNVLTDTDVDLDESKTCVALADARAEARAPKAPPVLNIDDDPESTETIITPPESSER